MNDQDHPLTPTGSLLLAQTIAERDNWQHIATQQRETMEAAIASMADWQRIAEERAHQIAELLERNADLVIARDAALQTMRDVTRAAAWHAHDATDPGPVLIAETRAAFPAAALRGGDGRPVW